MSNQKIGDTRTRLGREGSTRKPKVIREEAADRIKEGK